MKRVNPIFWFIIFQWIIATGTFVVADLSRSSDTLYCGLFFIAFFSFLLGANITTRRFNTKERYQHFFNLPLEDDHKLTKQLIYIVVIISAVISLLYYYAVGYNLFSDVVFGKVIPDFKSARLASYSGQNYYAPGYVNQFKNILLPVGLYVICLWLWFGGRRSLFYWVSSLTIVLCLYVLLGTGQRAPFVYSFVTCLFGLGTITKIRLDWLISGTVLVIALFGVFSVLNGRTESMGPFSMVESFVTRIFVNDQQEGLWGFRHILGLENAWFSDWGLGLLGILPNHSGSPLAHELYFLLHGTARGTSGLSTVGSAFHNGGLALVLVFYFLLGCFYSIVFNRLLSGRRTVLRGMSYGGLIFILSVFVSGAPVVLLKKGLLAFLLLITIRKLRIIPVTITDKRPT
ncbi:MAG: hypothetical protein GQ475_01950 [Methylococcaceae bacterium]|nr:hypothetical protein [Methylococcaceae bacterium]